jgi:hypothetical protein
MPGVALQKKPLFHDAFLQNAASIYSAAEAAVASGQEVTAMTILVRSDGSVRMVADSDWPLESLRIHHGADMAYRVSKRERNVSVDGRTGSRNCRMESRETESAARRILGGAALYRLEGTNQGSGLSSER